MLQRLRLMRKIKTELQQGHAPQGNGINRTVEVCLGHLQFQVGILIRKRFNHQKLIING